MTALAQLKAEELTDDEMASLLGYSVRTLRNKLSAGEDLPPHSGKGLARRWPIDGYKAWRKRLTKVSSSRL